MNVLTSKCFKFYFLLAFVLYSSATLYAQKGNEELGKKPNILVIVSDQLNWDYISAAGNQYVNTPNIDRLCEYGVRFDRAYVMNPVCIPSRISMFTGKRPSQFGVHVPKGINIQRNDMVTYVREKKIASLFQQQGYETYYGGKTHFGTRGYEFTPEDMGFEVYADKYEYRAEDGVSQALATLNDHKINHSKQPFLMVASLMNPHDICYAHIRDNRFDMEKILSRTKGGGWKKKLQESVLGNLKIPEGKVGAGTFEPIDHYIRNAPPLPGNYLPQKDEPSVISGVGEPEGKGMAAAFGRYRDDYDETDWLLHRYAYCKFVEDFDLHLGKLLDGLEASGLAKETYIILTSDHGESLGSHQMAGKGLLYDEVCHVPFIVSHPSFTQGRVDSVNIVSNGLDLLPSLYELAGLKADPTLEGVSIIPLLKQPKLRLKRTAIPVEFSTGLGMITENFYYGIYVKGNSNNEQLYDIRKRPLQMVNDAIDPIYKDALKRHRKEFNKVHQETLNFYGNLKGFTKYLEKK